MKTSLILLALLISAATVPVNAQARGTGDSRSGLVQATAANANEADMAPPATRIDDTRSRQSVQTEDITHLVPKNSAPEDGAGRSESSHRFNSRGVDCTLYPARCD